MFVNGIMEFLGVNFTIVIDVGFVEIFLSFLEEFSLQFVWHALGHLLESSYGLWNGDGSVAIGVNFLQNMFHDLFGRWFTLEFFKLSKVEFSAVVVSGQGNSLGGIDEHECGHDEE